MSNIKIACYADLHGVLPNNDHVYCDLAIVAGDVCPEYSMNTHKQFGWLHGPFSDWLKKFPRAVWVAGNHDYVCEFSHILPQPKSQHHYLQDSMVARLFDSFYVSNQKWVKSKISSLNVWGTPYSLPYGSYAFMAKEEEMKRKFEALEVKNAHIIVSHGPPYLCGDAVYRPEYKGYENTGSIELLDTIARNKPWLVVCGHIHQGRGIYSVGPTTIVNAAMAGESPGLGLDYPPIIIELNDRGEVENLTL